MELFEIKNRDEIFDYLGKEVLVKVDRPKNSIHPNHMDIIYPINYGFIPNTKALDGEEIDAYILGVDEIVDEYKGFVIAVIRRNNDNEDKLIVCPKDKSFTKEEIIKQTYFQEKFFDIEVKIKENN